MKYKPGDKVRIKSLDWYNENKDEDGRVYCDYIGFCKEMINYCGKELTIDFIHGDDGKSVYVMNEPKINWGFTDEMIEGLANEPQERMVSLDKACEWLRRNYTNYMINDLSKYVEDVCSFDIFDDLLVDDFRKAMEE